MKNNKGTKILGIILIILGIIGMLNVLGIADINIFFTGWWSLIFIIPAIISIINKKGKDIVGDLITLTIGVMLLLAANDIVNMNLILKLILPIILIVMGVSFLFRDYINKNITEKIKGVRSKNENLTYSSVFSSQKTKILEVKNIDATAIFGSIEFDLTELELEQDMVIKATTVFGGIELIINNHYDFEVKSTSLFGGVDDKRNPVKKQEAINIKNNTEGKRYTIFIDAACFFGGVEIK